MEDKAISQSPTNLEHPRPLIGSALLGLLLGTLFSAISLWYQYKPRPLFLDDLAIIGVVAIGSALVCTASARGQRPVILGAFYGSILWLGFFVSWHTVSIMSPPWLLGNVGNGLVWGTILGLSAKTLGRLRSARQLGQVL
jgi:hypothetical protein